MSQIIDRRLNGKKKSAVNRRRFIERFKKVIKKSVSDAIAKRSITDIDKGEKVKIPTKDISEPNFGYGNGGEREQVLPGNKEFITGDHIARPDQRSGQGNGSEASDKGEGEDCFAFEITRDEFLDLYFDDLELPDLIRKELTQINEFKYVRAGFTTAGVPTNINIIRSMKQATGRRIALVGPYRKKLKEAEAELKALQSSKSDDSPEIVSLKDRIQHLKKKIKSIPFLDSIDLRYNNRVKQSKPSTQAVMFCIMDVSGSMDELKKDIAKRFFILLYLFLKRNYEKIELVFIRHHTSAKEVDENEFFYSRETGGTVVSSALETMRDIIQDRYPSESWNIYAAQASDGDNWNADSPYCSDLLQKEIMPYMQYFAYVEIMPRHHQSLWEAYQRVKEVHPNFAMENIDTASEIYPVFRELFKKDMA